MCSSRRKISICSLALTVNCKYSHMLSVILKALQPSSLDLALVLTKNIEENYYVLNVLQRYCDNVSNVVKVTTS